MTKKGGKSTIKGISERRRWALHRGAKRRHDPSLFSPAYFWLQFKKWRRRSWWNKFVVAFLAVSFVLITLTYSVAQWYIYTNRNTPIELGATFVPGYAKYFGLDPHETMAAMVDGLGFQRLRLVSYWDSIEKTPNSYDFTELDWEMNYAEQHHVSISLSVGLRQPRWPECHMPGWAKTQTYGQWYPELTNFMHAVVERYKNSPALQSYQLENEFLLTAFGDCPDHSRDRLVEEFGLLRKWDSSKPIIVTRSNNATPSWPVGDPRADQVGAAVYKRVWDKTVTKRYFEYPIPAWYYAFLAGATKLTTGRETFLHELQAEPWLPDGYDLKTATIKEQNYTMDADRLHQRFEYGRATGMKTLDLWGVEWWYYRLKQGDPSIWNAAKEEINKTNAQNAKL